MICLDTIEQFHIEEPTALTIGKFDGLHRGHEELITHLLEKEHEGLKSVIFSFDIPEESIKELDLLTKLYLNEKLEKEYKMEEFW